jgi:F420H(2)-dependent quinone reductase
VTADSDRAPAGRDFSGLARMALRVLGGIHERIYRATDGAIGGRLVGSPVLLLTTVGRKTGEDRTAPLLYLEDGGRLVVVASMGGAPRHPAWYLNLVASGEARVRVGDRTLRVKAEEARDEEKSRLWARLVEMYPPYESYQRRTEREIPVVLLRPVEGEVAP